MFYPLASINGRQPLITHEFEPGKHLGVDLGFRTEDFFDGTKEGVGLWNHHDLCVPSHKFYQPPESTWVAMLDGTVLYSKMKEQIYGIGAGWRIRIRTTHGFDVLYLHGVEGTQKVHDHQLVKAGDELCTVGYDLADPQGWRHLHLEIRVPGQKHQTTDGYGCVAVDPEKFIKGLHAQELKVAA